MKKSLYIIYLFLILAFSLTASYAGDVNSTDFDIVGSNESGEVYALESDLSLYENSKNMTCLDSLSDSVYYNGNYEVSLKDSITNQTLPNRTVSFSVDGENYTVLTDDEGIAGLRLNLPVGKHTVTSSFMGDDIYGNCTLTEDVTVLSTLIAKDIKKYYGAGTKYSATFLDSNGIPLANVQVSIVVNGKVYSKRTNANGVVGMAVNLNPGTYRITSTDPITGLTVTTTFKILATISSSNLQKFIGDGKKFTAKFLKSNGKPLAKKYIKFKLKGKRYKVKTNSKGIASLSLKKLKKGTYNIICYNKDGYKKTFKIQVYKKKAATGMSTKFYTFLENQTKQIMVKFKTSIGGASVASKVIKIKINGKTYSKKTDSSGKAYLTLPDLEKGIYTVTYSYAGTKYFKSSKATDYVTVLNQTNASFTVKSTTSFGYGAGTQFKVKLTADGVPLAKKEVTFKVSSYESVKTTSSKGIASITIKMGVGNYKIQYSVPSDSYINGSSDECDVEVFKRSASRLTWKSASTFKDSSQTFMILLVDSNGNPISGETVKLTIDGKTYSAKTSSKGMATFKTSVALGKYDVKISYGGSNFYIKSSASKSVNVKLSYFKAGVNQKASGISSSYLKSSSHCKVGAKAVKKMVKKLTKGLKSKTDKAKAIYNYVRDTLGYRFYYDTRYGSTKTLKIKSGNCVDHSHLLVAMFRTAGLKARYVHGSCTFSDGRYGHVWAQVYLDGHWVGADATSYRNQLGKIKNWNTKTAKIHSGYHSLPF